MSPSFLPSVLRAGLAVACGVLAPWFLPGCRPKQAERADVIVLHTGRLRGNIYPLELQLIAPLQHYQFLAGYVGKVREEAKRTGARVVLVDLGDSLDGTFASHVTGSRNVVDFFNALGYDAIQLGNLDSQVPASVLESIDAKILNPFVGPDGKTTNPGAPAAAEILPATPKHPPVYLVANFYGDTDPAQYPVRFPNSFGEAARGVRPVRDYAPVLEALGPRPPGSLTLFGWEKFESPDAPPEEYLRKLREWGVDAILAQRIYGSNQKDIWSENRFSGWNPPVSQNILRNNRGFTLARMDLRWDGTKWEVLGQELVPMTANTAPKDEEIVKLEGAFAPRILAADRTVRKLPVRVGEKEILDACLRGLTTIPEAEAVVYSSQSVRSGWPPGLLRASAVFNSIPWTSALVRMDLTRDELLDLRIKNPGLTFWERESDVAEEGLVSLVTSRFFANLFSQQLDRAVQTLPAADGIPEFDFLLRFLESGEDVFAPGLPEGWNTLTAPAPGG